MWEKDLMTLERIEENIIELNQMTDKFFETASFYLENIEGLEGQQEVIIRAINYIEETHAIPPFRGNYAWFDHTHGGCIDRNGLSKFQNFQEQS